MYSVYAGNTCIYDDTSSAKELRLINPVLELGDNAAGSFKMTVPVTNAGYQIIDRLTTYIRVEKDGQEMWEGRIIDEKIDYWKNRTLTCEGELAYLNDSTQPPAEYHNMTVRGFLETLLNIHNAKVSADKQFQVGAVTVTDPNDSLYRYTNYEKTIECINKKLVESLGGHLSVRKENGVRYLDYLADKQSTNTQLIEFGTNLLDYAASFDMTDYATVIVPLGEKLDESPIAALEAYLTVSSVNEGSIYVQNAEAVQNFGWIEKVVHFDRVTVASNLLRKAQQYLSELQFDNMVLEVKAVDLHYMNPGIEGVKLSDQIRVISTPHGLNKVFPVSKLSIPLDRPENTMFTLGTNIKMSLTEANNKTNNEIIKQIEAIPTKQSVLEEAQDNAESIMDLATNGFVTITKDQNGSEAIYISDTQDLSQATKWWRWNANGLAYYNTNMGSSNPLVAMTMDGAIVADRITAGTLRADLLDAVRIKASTFYLENESDPSQTAESLGSVIQRFTLADGQLSSEISSLGQSYTEIRQSMSDITLRAVSGTPKTDVGTLASSHPSGSYAFTRTSDGYYTSSNAGINSSYSYGTLNFNFAQDTLVSFDCVSNGESGYDFGILSELDKSLTEAFVEDQTNVFHSFKNEASSTPQTFSMYVPSGQHFVTFKYIKDGSTSSGDDYFKINSYTGTGEHGAMISIDSNDGIVSSAANIAFNGLVTFSDLSGTGTTQINGANIMTGTLYVKEVYSSTNDGYRVLSSGTEAAGSGTRFILDVGYEYPGSYNQSIIVNRATEQIFTSSSNGYSNITSGFGIDIANQVVTPLGPSNAQARDRAWQLGGPGSPYGQAITDQDYGWFSRIYMDAEAYLYVDRYGALVFHDKYGNETTLT